MGVDLKRKGTEPTSGSQPKKRLKRTNVQLQDWTVEQVLEWAKETGFADDVIDLFAAKGIDGKKLSLIDEETVKDYSTDISDEDHNKLLEELDILREDAGGHVKNKVGLYRTPTKYMPPGEETKVFNDPIHGHIEMHPLCTKVIDTKEFQRLRYLKQLGGCYFVFPGASHNRFEHCIGVSHLAGELVRMLQRRQPELNINDKDILCVELAGLCHDLGHGPFSHMFDNRFIKLARPGLEWEHEKASVEMFNHLVKKNNLIKEFNKFGLYDRDLKFIAEQIEGPRFKPSGQYPYEGRREAKSFLYEIVANKRNGIDVDKWDYFARDCHHLGIKNNFDHTRFMKFVRVIQVEDGQKQICSRDKEVDNIYDMFATRAMLHRRAYQHKTNIIVERMICEAFLKADKFLKFPGKDGELLCLSDTINDMEAYSRVNDFVFHQILNSAGADLASARQILERVERRDLYKCVGQTRTGGNKVKEADIDRSEIVTALTENELGTSRLQSDDIVVLAVNLDYGMKDQNPIDNVRFYRKNNLDIAIKVRKEEVSEMLPRKFSDQLLRVYCKKTDTASCTVAERCFNKWCQAKQLGDPKGGDVDISMTPCKPGTSASSNGGDSAPNKILHFD